VEGLGEALRKLQDRLAGARSSMESGRRQVAALELESASMQHQLDGVEAKTNEGSLYYRVTASLGLVIRSEVELSSPETTRYPRGAIFEVFERRPNKQGLMRLRTQDGWASELDAVDHSQLSEPVEQPLAKVELERNVEELERHLTAGRYDLRSAEQRVQRLEQDGDLLDRQLALATAKANGLQDSGGVLQDRLAAAQAMARSDSAQLRAAEVENFMLRQRLDLAEKTGAKFRALAASRASVCDTDKSEDAILDNTPPVKLRFRVLSPSGLVVRAGLEIHDREVRSFPQGYIFDVFDAQKNSQGILRLKVSADEALWVSLQSAIDGSALAVDISGQEGVRVV